MRYLARVSLVRAIWSWDRNSHVPWLLWTDVSVAWSKNIAIRWLVGRPQASE